jgi:dienelactone hydrolase
MVNLETIKIMTAIFAANRMENNRTKESIVDAVQCAFFLHRLVEATARDAAKEGRTVALPAFFATDSKCKAGEQS